MKLFKNETLETAILREILKNGLKLTTTEQSQVKERYLALLTQINEGSTRQIKLNPNQLYPEFFQQVTHNFLTEKKAKLEAENSSDSSSSSSSSSYIGNTLAILDEDISDRMNTGSFGQR